MARPVPASVWRPGRLAAVAVRPPWSWAIRRAGARVLNRDDRPPRRLLTPRRPLATPRWRHLLAIYSGARIERRGLEVLADLGYEPARSELVASACQRCEWRGPWRRVCPECGGKTRQQGLGVVAVARVVACGTSPSRRDHFGWWSGPYGWELADVEPLPSPVPCPGHRRLWRLTGDDSAEVIHQLGKLAA